LPLIKKRIALALAPAAAAVAMMAPVASAAVADPTACTGQTFSQVFLPFGDTDWYTPVPDSGFEGVVSEWQLEGGAVIAPDLVDNRPADGALDASSLRLPEGASATTAPMCVTDAHRTMRFFTRGDQGLLGGAGTVRVEMITEFDGVRRVELLKQVVPGLGWGLSPVLRLDTRFYETTKTSPTSTVRFRVSAADGAVAIDDVFVDPRMV
jgi:hypothetical protein